MRAESIAKAVAEDQVIANEIAVLPPGAERVAKSVNAAQDYEIKKNLDAELLLHALHDEIKYDVRNGVVTLRGSVSSEKARAAVEQFASRVPNVAQVVNKLDVTNQKATSTR